MSTAQYTLDDLLRIMQQLRDPQTGCPWDIQQSFASIVPSTLEECYELAEAIEQGDHAQIAEELGDVLFQVVFYAQLGREEGLFTFVSIVDLLSQKLIRRHPHVFARSDTDDVAAPKDLLSVQQRWESSKRNERVQKALEGVLDDVPIALPALPRAQKLQKRAEEVGFDWASSGQVLEKVEEEIAELREAIGLADRAQIENELGDLFFSCVNLARHLKCDAESSLRGASSKFERRVRDMETLAKSRGARLDDLTTEQLDALWQAVKQGETALVTGL